MLICSITPSDSTPTLRNPERIGTLEVAARILGENRQNTFDMEERARIYLKHFSGTTKDKGDILIVIADLILDVREANLTAGKGVAAVTSADPRYVIGYEVSYQLGDIRLMVSEIRFDPSLASMFAAS